MSEGASHEAGSPAPITQEPKLRRVHMPGEGRVGSWWWRQIQSTDQLRAQIALWWTQDGGQELHVEKRVWRARGGSVTVTHLVSSGGKPGQAAFVE